jgi:LPXTG-site transpeptidase (sortase) family protein
VAYPVHITVGDTISIPVEEAQTVNGSMEISPTAANHVFNSALPGEEGNIIILGNNLTSVFGLLAQARIGDLVTLRTGDGNLYTYIITQIRVEIPDQIGLLAPTSSEVLTLYTQTGLLNSQRLIVKAEPVK